MPTNLIFDAHLDLAMNARRGRDITKPASAQPLVETEIATVGLPDLEKGNVRKICATIFCEPSSGDKPGYQNTDEAYEEAVAQFRFYKNLAIKWTQHQIDPIYLIEGADCIRSVADLEYFKSKGARIIGLSWKSTRYAGGTGEPGPITTDGIEMIKSIDRLGLIHDASHLAEESFWNLIERAQGAVISSHSNCRAIVGDDPRERHLSDEMIRAIIKRNGMLGINFYEMFLLPTTEYKKRRATLNDVVRHIQHVCDLAGNADHVGLGTDMDGGLGREQIPVEIETSADLPKLANALLSSGFSSNDVDKILYGNWNAYFSRHLK